MLVWLLLLHFGLRFISLHLRYFSTDSLILCKQHLLLLTQHSSLCDWKRFSFVTFDHLFRWTVLHISLYRIFDGRYFSRRHQQNIKISPNLANLLLKSFEFHKGYSFFPVKTEQTDYDQLITALNIDEKKVEGADEYFLYSYRQTDAHRFDCSPFLLNIVFFSCQNWLSFQCVRMCFILEFFYFYFLSKKRARHFDVSNVQDKYQSLPQHKRNSKKNIYGQYFGLLARIVNNMPHVDCIFHEWHLVCVYTPLMLFL